MSGEHERKDWKDEDVMQALDRVARLERELRDEVRGPARPEEHARVMKGLFGEATPAPRARSASWIWLAAAGLLVATTALWLLRDPASSAPVPGTVLSGNSLDILEPLGAVDEFTELRWKTRSSGNPRFRVRVLDDADGHEWVPATIVTGTRFSLAELDTSAWGRVRFEVEELDASGVVTEANVARAWRR